LAIALVTSKNGSRIARGRFPQDAGACAGVIPKHAGKPVTTRSTEYTSVALT
jgi:hypothetical protein